jgi:hypothetical protein
VKNIHNLLWIEKLHAIAILVSVFFFRDIHDRHCHFARSSKMRETCDVRHEGIIFVIEVNMTVVR